MNQNSGCSFRGIEKPLFYLLARSFVHASFLAIFVEAEADAGWLLGSRVNDGNFTYPDWLSDIDDTALWVGFVRLHVLLNNVDAFNRNFVLSWMGGNNLASLALVLAGQN